MEKKNEVFGKRLRILRDRKGMSQEKIANSIGISRASYSHYETNRVEPDMEIIVTLAKYHNVTTDYLLGKSDKKESDWNSSLITKDEKDIAKRLDQFKKEVEGADGLAFDGEPMSEEARESLVESMEHIFRTTQRINKKYIPIKYRKDDSD